MQGCSCCAQVPEAWVKALTTGGKPAVSATMHSKTVHARAFLHLQLTHMIAEALRITKEYVNESIHSCPEETQKGLSGDEEITELITSGHILQSTWHLMLGLLFARTWAPFPWLPTDSNFWKCGHWSKGRESNCPLPSHFSCPS